MISVTKTFNKTFSLMKNKQLWWLALIQALIIISITFLTPTMMTEPENMTESQMMNYLSQFFTILAITGIISMIINYSIIKTYYLLLNKKKVNVKQVLIEGVKKFPKMFLLSFIIGLIELLGIIVLIVPGVILIIIFFYTTVIYVIKSEEPITELVTYSWKIGKKNFLRTVVLSIIIILFSLLVFIPVLFMPSLNLIITPILSLITNGVITVYYIKGLNHNISKD